MEQAFVEGRRMGTSIIEVGPCVVTAIKNVKKDGYWAVQIGFGERKAKNVTKPMKGHFKKAGLKKNPHFLYEVKTSEEPKYKVGDIIKVADIFNEKDVVSVTGVSKGKGFAGVMKRWNFAGGPATHGQSDRSRAPGSIGQGTDPGRVRKGKKMAGRMGTDRANIKNLKVISVDSENNKLVVSGPVPGSNGTILYIEKTP